MEPKNELTRYGPVYDSCIGKEIGERRLKQSADKVQYSVEKHLSHGSGKKDG